MYRCITTTKHINSNLRRYRSVRRIRRAQHSFVSNPQRVSSSSSCSRLLDTPLPGRKPAVAPSLFRQSAPRRIRYDRAQTESVLDRLPGIRGGGAVCGPWVRELLCIEFVGQVRANAPFPPYYCHGNKEMLTTFVRYHDPEASLEEGLDTLKRCIDEVAKRLVVSPGKYKVKVVDKDGIREVEI